jgi:lipid II:glycine glycyltransferase (peptidoglycan interpeptide bridge formation enzyme)
MEDAEPILEKCGFSYEPHLNYLIDLNRPSEEIFEGIGRRTRKNIRHGLNRGDVRIREVREHGEVATCYELLRQTYRAARVPMFDISLFEAALDVLSPRKMIRFTLAEVGGAAAATSIELVYKDVVYGWYGGIDRKYRKYMAGELLMWHILQWGAESGYHVYDFGGAGKPEGEYGVRDFKAKFGGELVCYGRNMYVHAPRALWLSRKGYEMVRYLSRGLF